VTPIRVGACVALMAISGPAAAFSPAVHRALSERAVALEADTSPALARQSARVARATAWEDWNLARKWIRWNHYFSPNFPVPTLWRRPSNERVAGLEARIRGSTDRDYRLLGLAVHHVQDMASPPHVVPIVHGLGDGFESWEMRDLIGDLRGEDVPALDPAEAQRALARETEALVERGALHCEGRDVPLAEVWHTRERAFGRKGEADFGGLPGCEEAETAFVRDRLDRAVAFTRSVLRWSVASGG
jgi:hypothetical protein